MKTTTLILLNVTFQVKITIYLNTRLEFFCEQNLNTISESALDQDGHGQAWGVLETAVITLIPSEISSSPCKLVER